MPATINPMYMELIDKLSQVTGTDVQAAGKMIDAFVESLKKHCADGDAVAIPGFGTFQTVRTPEYISETYRPGKRYLMPPEVNISLKTSVVLRKKLLG